MFNPIDGLRIFHDAHQLAVIERNSTLLTNIVNEVISNLEEGMSEVDVARLIQFSGEHHLYYPIICIGEKRIKLAYAKPSKEFTLTDGEQILISLGFGGSAHAREGRFLHFEEKLVDTPIYKIYEQFFEMKYVWLTNLAIGNTGHQLFQLVDQIYDRELKINPGHNIDEYQEWTQSTFRRDDRNIIQSGMVFHIDIITETFNNDTIAVASMELRESLSTNYPGTVERIQQRRDYLKTVIGLELDESVLPFSDNLLIQPYIRSPRYVFINHQTARSHT
jgi:Xaa-Pro aminopeptidase